MMQFKTALLALLLKCTLAETEPTAKSNESVESNATMAATETVVEKELESDVKTSCEWNIPTTPCGEGCIRNDLLGILICMNDTCVLADPLPQDIQDILDTGIMTADSYLEQGCFESYTKPDNALIVSTPTAAPSADLTEKPTTSGAKLAASFCWVMLMPLFAVWGFE